MHTGMPKCAKYLSKCTNNVCIMWPFKRKEEHKGHVLTDDDRAFSAHTRNLQMKADLMDLEEAEARHNLEMARIQAELQEVVGDGQQNPDMQIIMLLSKILGKGTGEQGIDVLGGLLQPATQPQPTHVYGAPVRRSLSNEELHGIKSRMIAQAVQQYGVPEKLILSHIRKMDDNALLEKARQYAPDLVDQVDEDTLKRALVVIRE